MSGADHRTRRIASFMTLAREELRAAAKLQGDNERQNIEAYLRGKGFGL